VTPTSLPAPVLPGFATAPQASAPPLTQQSLDELGMPLAEVTFVVVDLETTGTSPGADAITEIGALRLRGGELLGRFETFVNPGVPIPPMITVLTGITEAMLLPAPRITEVLPAFLEFAHDAVIVGHNIRFDCGFLDAALVANGYGRLPHRRVDTVALARRLVRDEVPNLRLHTLARHFRTTVEPVHRAYADAAATAEVLHALLERAAAFGVLGLDDLLALPSMRAHPSAAKLALTATLPRLPGVYLFRDRDGRVLYVGKATNLRARVRSYFSTEDRRKVPQLLRETVRIEHRVCRGPLEAAVRELRLIQRLEPRFNRES
jgi:DNA polymerase III subunit epsilon